MFFLFIENNNFILFVQRQVPQIHKMTTNIKMSHVKYTIIRCGQIWKKN